MMLVGNDDEEFDIDDSYTVAVVSGSQTLTNEIVSNFPNFTVVSYDTIEECFESVRKGKNDFLMADRYIVNYWLTRPIYNDLYILPVDGLSDELCFSAVVDIYGINTMSGLNGVELVSIINKALSQISEDEIEEIIINENNAHAYSYTLDDFLYSYRYATLIGIIAIIVAVILYINTEKLKNKARKIQENESKRIALQNKRYQMMMDSSGEMLYDINIMGESGFISEQIKLKFGWSMPERVTDFTACRLREIFHIHPDDWRREHKKIKNSLDNNIPCKCLVRIMPSEGDDIWCKIYFFPLLNDEKKLVSIIGKIEDVDKDTKEKDKLKHESETDFMTGLMNKLTFEARTVKLMTKKNVYNSALLFVDLDHFKAVNDLLGHSIGDEVIKETATKLQKLFANVDLVSRFGGDEFCVFVWNIPMSKLIDKLERLLSIMNKTYSNGEACVNITASIGVVYCKKEDVDYKTMLNIADEALYEAKDIGRNRYVIKEL
jgi:diguanylate cyclase (GGDEF)-like protein